MGVWTKVSIWNSEKYGRHLKNAGKYKMSVMTKMGLPGQISA